MFQHSFMADRNHLNPDQSPLSAIPIQPSDEELFRLFQNLSTGEIGTGQNDSSTVNLNSGLGFQVQRHGGLLGSSSSSIPTLQSPIPMVHSFRHVTSSQIWNSNGLDSGIGTCSSRNPQTEITDFEGQRHGLLGSYQVPALQSPPLELQRSYPHQNTSMATMGPIFNHENSSFNGALLTHNLNSGLGFLGSSYGNNFVPDFLNFRPEVPVNQNGFNMNSFVDQNSSLGNSPMAASTGNYYSSGQINGFNEEARSDIYNQWTNQKVKKILKGDPTLLDEVSFFDLFVMANVELGSKYLLDILNSRDQWSIEKIIDRIHDYLVPLMSDQFGNQVFQRVLILSLPSQINAIAKKIISERYELINAASDKFGTYSIQKLIKSLKKPNRRWFIDSMMSILGTRLLYLMMDQSGSHLIQFLLPYLDYKQQSIYVVAVHYCLNLATNKTGCITLKAVMNTITNPLRDELLVKISNDAMLLSQDPFGNFIIQHVLQCFGHFKCFQFPDLTITGYICHKLEGKYVSLSKHKFGSHVVEKCISTEEGLEIVVFDLVGSDKLIEVAKDAFGNFVIQKALKATKERMRNDLYLYLVDILGQHSGEIKNHPQGSNVYNLINGKRR